MANILRGYGLAREQGYFKVEQEAEVQKHRQRLIKEGKLPPEQEEGKEEGRRAGPSGRGETLRDSEQHYEVLSEVLAQQARLDDPDALRRRQYDRRIKGEPPPLSEAELRAARSKLHALGAAVGHVPAMSLGRSRYAGLEAAGGGGGDLAGVAGYRPLTPEAREVAARTYVAGVRSLVYGSVLGAVALAAGVTWATQAAGIRSGEDLGQRMREGLAPLSASAREWMLPMKERLEGWLRPAPAPSGSDAAQEGGQLAAAAGGSAPEGGPATSEWSRRLQQRFHPKASPDGRSPF